MARRRHPAHAPSRLSGGPPGRTGPLLRELLPARARGASAGAATRRRPEPGGPRRASPDPGVRRLSRGCGVVRPAHASPAGRAQRDDGHGARPPGRASCGGCWRAFARGSRAYGAPRSVAGRGLDPLRQSKTARRLLFARDALRRGSPRLRRAAASHPARDALMPVLVDYYSRDGSTLTMRLLDSSPQVAVGGTYPFEHKFFAYLWRWSRLLTPPGLGRRRVGHQRPGIDPPGARPLCARPAALAPPRPHGGHGAGRAVDVGAGLRLRVARVLAARDGGHPRRPSRSRGRRPLLRREAHELVAARPGRAAAASPAGAAARPARHLRVTARVPRGDEGRAGPASGRRRGGLLPPLHRAPARPAAVDRGARGGPGHDDRPLRGAGEGPARAWPGGSRAGWAWSSTRTRSCGDRRVGWVHRTADSPEESIGRWRSDLPADVAEAIARELAPELPRSRFSS